MQISTAQQANLFSQFYGEEEGLSHRSVQAIQQDQEGFIWLGTDYGLNRFDGYNFKSFTKENSSLLSRKVTHILKDKEGILWLLDTEYYVDQKVNALTLFTPSTGIFQSAEEKFGKGLPISITDIIAFAQNEKGDLAFLTQNNQLHIYTDKWSKLPVPLAYKSLSTVRIRWESIEELQIIQEENDLNRISLLMDNKGKVLKESFFPCESFASSTFNPNDEREKPSLAYDSIADLKFFDLSTMPSFDTFCYFKKVESPSHLWVLTQDSRLIAVDKVNYRAYLLSEKYPSLKKISSLFLDKNNTVWVGTPSGVFHFQFKKSFFKKYVGQKEKRNGLTDFVCRQITKDDNNHLWVKTENPGSIWTVDLNIDKAINIGEMQSSLSTFPALGSKDKSLLFTSEKDLLYSNGRTVFQMNPKTYQYSQLDLKLSNRLIWTFHEDQYHQVWFADKSNNELGYIKSDEVILLPNKLGEKGFIYGYQFMEIAQSDTMWLATSRGLFTIDKKAGKILDHYWSKGQGKYFFPFEQIYHMYRDIDETLWVATDSEGVVQIKTTPEGLKILRRLTRTEGLSHNTVYSIFGDDYDNLWLATDYGIVQFNKKTGRFKGYTEKDGISDNEFNRGSHLQDENGTIYFGSMNGITAFHPKNFLSDTLSKNIPVVITSFEQYDGEENKLKDKYTEVNKSKRIVIRPKDQFFRLAFSLMTFDQTDKIQYAYRIEGIENNWNYQKENVLRLSGLPYGQHILRIKGQAANGEWSKQELAIAVKVLKPFYFQTWFLLLTFCSLFIGISLFYQWRVARLKKRQKELEKIVEDRTREIVADKQIIEQQNQVLAEQAKELKSLEKLKSRFFANVSHELRTPLTLMLGPVHSLLKRSTPNKTNYKLLQYIQRNGLQLQKLINEILDLSKLENNKLEVVEEAVSFYPYLKNQMVQFYSFADNHQLDLELNYEANRGLQILLDKSMFEKIIHNYLSNALKFTPPGGKVRFSVIEEEQYIQLSVWDNGRGIHVTDLPLVFDRFYQSKHTDAPTEGGTGIGLSMVKELATLLEGKVWVESQFGEGSVFYFQFPKKVTTAIAAESLEKFITTTPLSVDPKAKSTQATKILVVEDNSDLREYLQFLLSNYQVITAPNGQQALDLIQKQPLPASDQGVDLIISDLMMPVMDGFQLLEKLKSDNRWRHLPFLMLTAKVNVQAKLKALRVGVDDYLTKPFVEEELIARIENLLHNYQARMQFFSTNEKEEKRLIEKPVISQVEAEWLQQVEKVYTKYLSNNSLTLDFIASQLNLSTRQVQRRLKQLTGLSPSQYLQEMRLQAAQTAIVHGRFATIKEAAFAAGYRDTKHFSALFKKRFGKLPSAFTD